MTHEQYLNFYKSKAENNVMPDGVDEYLQTQKEMCATSLKRVFETFRPLLISIDNNVRSGTVKDTKQLQQWFIIYFIALAATRRDYAARCLNYVMGRDFADKVSANNNPYRADAMVRSAIDEYYNILDAERTEAEFLREMYVNTYHGTLGLQIRQGNELKTGSAFRAVVNPYMKKNAPADLWKVGLNVRNIRNNIRRVLQQQKTK